MSDNGDMPTSRFGFLSNFVEVSIKKGSPLSNFRQND